MATHNKVAILEVVPHESDRNRTGFATVTGLPMLQSLPPSSWDGWTRTNISRVTAERICLVSLIPLKAGVGNRKVFFTPTFGYHPPPPRTLVGTRLIDPVRFELTSFAVSERCSTLELQVIGVLRLELRCRG